MMNVAARLEELRRETLDVRRALSWEAGRQLRAVRDERERPRLETLCKELEERVEAVCREFSAIKSEMEMN